ncbi:MAG: hypothetical protein A2855_00625 [Candidatus Liptonbacteria bacterium RIFCSPHIGHO2_01_FULL_57_28]|uniref:MBL fold hydrolase n=1 Tax=Candidatus Liptonbacteria bacterium RIFCSPHIGHO2_01_FULL_57_28 TaxID=1798647 RepID=A0A1G2CBK2_9BACT|nr:MAG: hypothetical protein A2855_00625 [Candidatus Liptonbacteria bacterium RIFCSPHIGHO2_01_FULL_57_28]
MRLTFCGGASEVTGSNYLLESKNGEKILIDCGLSQGGHYAEEENFQPFPYDLKEIQAVLVTHAHIDHVGRIPQLVKLGFRGKIYSTPPTRDFAELLLLDSEHILGKEAETHGHEPLYFEKDVKKTMSMWKGVPYHKMFQIGGFNIEIFDAGHVLGSAFYRVHADGKSIVFSGDLGNSPAPIIRDLEPLPESDYVLLESTYGARVHDEADTRQKDLMDAIIGTIRAGGVLMIPAFALERTQDLLYHMDNLVEGGKIPRVPIYMDSPLAIKLTKVYRKYHDYFNETSAAAMASGNDILNFPGLHPCLTPEESKAINRAPAPKVIIAGSGMSNGGRILHHEMRYLSDPKSCLLIVGYQARGTLGRRLQDGDKQVHIFGVEVQVRAKIRSMNSYSAHADGPHLLAWLEPRRDGLKKVFMVHGEEDQGDYLARKVRDELGVAAEVPARGQVVEL